MTIPDIAGEAESLIRALRGVAHARIHATESGIESVHVTASDPDAARHLAGHVRSALLAGLAAPVLPNRIHVRLPETQEQTGKSEAPGHVDESVGAPEPVSEPTQPSPRRRLGLLHGNDGTGGFTAERPSAGQAESVVPERSDPDTQFLTARPRLVSVDAERPGDGRLVCRVAITYQTRVHRAEAVAVDLPGAAAQAAAQATVRALLDAGIPGLELSGLREVEIAGRDYVLVALRRTDPYPRNRSGSAPIIGSAERSAAEATVAAAYELT